MKNLIFDFDGTIVESDQLIYTNLVAHTKNTSFTWDQLRDLPSDQVVKILNISKLDLPKLIIKIRKDFKLKIKDQPIVSGMKEALLACKKEGFSLYIVSSNSKENISSFLKIHDLDQIFSGIVGFFTIFGKAHGIKKMITEIPCNEENALYIGDESRDIEAARKIGIHSIAVTWGYNSAKVLETYKPDHLVRTPQELASVLCSTYP